MFNLDYYRIYGVKVAQKWYNTIWWKLMPGTTIKVRWPVGKIFIPKDVPYWMWIAYPPGQHSVESADPNDHYRSWLESNVGKQGWDWDWALRDNDIVEKTLTIKFRHSHRELATAAKIMWSK